MTPLNLQKTAAGLPEAWRSRVLGRVGTADVKVLRMDGAPVEVETHENDEALIVVEGHLTLELAGGIRSMSTGDLCVVPAGTPHAVLPGSTGTLLIVEVDPATD
ncbi:cupin domain-containing protein [Streptomyces sp. NPDC058330]|uniref:cupin domain-containing protein n=1 Tax=Streptomyces sp. NPDC058330 TaxID=3346449 RepID=UPI0036EAE244